MDSNLKKYVGVGSTGSSIGISIYNVQWKIAVK